MIDPPGDLGCAGIRGSRDASGRHLSARKSIGMNLLADEGVEKSIVLRLRSEGHQVDRIAEFAPSLSDDDVLRQPNSRDAMLLTSDKDFGELVYRLGRVHAGVILIRLAGLSPAEKSAVVAEAIAEHRDEFHGSFCVISAGQIRIRRKSVG